MCTILQTCTFPEYQQILIFKTMIMVTVSFLLESLSQLYLDIKEQEGKTYLKYSMFCDNCMLKMDIRVLLALGKIYYRRESQSGVEFGQGRAPAEQL